MQMRKKSIITFCFVVVAAIVLNLVAFFGLPGSLNEKYGGMFSANGIKQSIDLVGGSELTFQADAENPTNEQMTAVEEIYKARLNLAGYTEAQVSHDGRNVTIAITSGKSVFDKSAENTMAETPAVSAAPEASAAPAATGEPEASAAPAATETPAEAAVETMSASEQTKEAVELLTKVAKLTFRDYSGQVVLEGSGVKSAKMQYGRPNETDAKQYYVQVEFTSEGAKKFSAATAAAAAKPEGQNIVRIFMDETEVSAPRVEQRIDNTSCVIQGNFTRESAQTLAAQISSGNLPFGMTLISTQTIGAELGDTALPTCLLAAGIGILLVMLFMLFRYKLPGLIADLSLLIYVGLICLAMGVFHLELSLSGIAGIVLSIGMAVDADCIIFERMREELTIGKSIRASVESGFSKAFSAIIDSNITTIISCIVLYMSGIGTVIGFATTLGVGVVLSMFTAIVITKFLLRNLVKIGVTNRKLFYSPKKETGGASNE